MDHGRTTQCQELLGVEKAGFRLPLKLGDHARHRHEDRPPFADPPQRVDAHAYQEEDDRTVDLGREAAGENVHGTLQLVPLPYGRAGRMQG